VLSKVRGSDLARRTPGKIRKRGKLW